MSFELDEEPQLDLFTWDRVKVREGFAALARLDPTEAVRIFEGVISRWHGHPDALAGLRMARAWDELLRQAETLEKGHPAAFLWEKIRGMMGPLPFPSALARSSRRAG